jgi:hypothetical protein
MIIDMAEIIPKEPNQLSEIYATKNNLTGNNTPVITENTIKPSRKFFFFKIYVLSQIKMDLRDSFTETNSIKRIFDLY